MEALPESPPPLEVSETMSVYERLREERDDARRAKGKRKKAAKERWSPAFEARRAKARAWRYYRDTARARKKSREGLNNAQ